ncbi:MAG: tetratricopeptide repeat protein, partial [Proteobacteria bacterium]|nr:tetratricopeptide repeat protein [Pseudomonadota bacterium]
MKRSDVMGYLSGKAARPKKKSMGKSKKAWAALLIVLIIAAAVAAGFLFPHKARGVAAGLARLKNAFFFAVLGQPPRFYSLTLEKNGKDYRITAQDVFEVSYRDEFVIKEISTDVLFGGGVTADFEGIGEKDDSGRLLKGIELVDKAVLTGRNSLGEGKPGDFSLRIEYKGEEIASIPVRIQITPQDWLRYARSSGNQKVQIEYLKRAIAMSPEDANVRRMLASIYFQAGMTREAIAQYQEVLTRKPDDAAVLAELAKCYLKSGQYQEVIRTSERSLRANPQDEDALANMALAWGSMGNWNKAIASYQAALKIKPDNPVAIFRLGEAYEKSKQLAKAAEQYRL